MKRILVVFLAGFLVLSFAATAIADTQEEISLNTFLNWNLENSDDLNDPTPCGGGNGSGGGAPG